MSQPVPNPSATSERRHPRVLDPADLIVNVISSVLGAIIGMQLITRLGITAYTSIIGAIAAMAIARIPVGIFRRFRSVQRQNLVETTMSSATFAAGNALMLPIAIPLAMGHPELVMPMLLGAALATLVDATVLYRAFDSRIFPVEAAWPAGVATAETIKAGDKGGRQAVLLGAGAATGVVGAAFGVPMSAFGVAFIGNVVALTAFGLGCLIAGYGPEWFGLDITGASLPQGLMLGAGVVALGQVIWTLAARRRERESAAVGTTDGGQNARTASSRSSDGSVLATGIGGTAAFIVAGALMIVVSGLGSGMSAAQVLGLILFTGLGAIFHQILVGYSAMLAGWFPSVPVALMLLIFGLMLGFPAVPLGLAVGFLSATGVCFADMGYDLKAGWILRGEGTDPTFELAGRRQQYVGFLLAYVIGIVLVALFHDSYFAGGHLPPPAKVFATAIDAGASTDLLRELVLWAAVGAILQLAGGIRRQIGLLLATGLLIASGAAGWAVLAGIVIRVFVRRRFGEKSEKSMNVFAAGCIAGDAIYGFAHSMLSSTGGK